MQKLERFVIGRTYNAVHMGNTYGLRPAFDAVAVFYQNAEKEQEKFEKCEERGKYESCRERQKLEPNSLSIIIESIEF